MTYMFVSIMLFPGKYTVIGYVRGGTVVPLHEFGSLQEAVTYALTVKRKKPNITLCGPIVEGGAHG